MVPWPPVRLIMLDLCSSEAICLQAKEMLERTMVSSASIWPDCSCFSSHVVRFSTSNPRRVGFLGRVSGWVVPKLTALVGDLAGGMPEKLYGRRVQKLEEGKAPELEKRVRCGGEEIARTILSLSSLCLLCVCLLGFCCGLSLCETIV